jgi:hypothetical protein
MKDYQANMLIIIGILILMLVFIDIVYMDAVSNKLTSIQNMLRNVADPATMLKMLQELL